MSYYFQTTPRKKTRISYKKLTDAVNQWNTENNLQYLDKGFVKVGNDGNVHWLQYLTEQGATKCKNVSDTDGSLKSCYNRLTYLSKESVGL
jgi:hypothetical protein